MARMVRDVQFLELLTRYQPGRAGAVAINGGYWVGGALGPGHPSDRRPLNPCGAAVQRPEGIAQRRLPTVSAAIVRRFRINGGHPWPGARSAPLKLYVEQVLTSHGAL